LSRGSQFRHDGVRGERCQLSGSSHPAGKVRFERRLIVVASPPGLTRNLDHGFPAGSHREEDLGACQDAFDPSFPFRISSRLVLVSKKWINWSRKQTYVIEHVRGAHEHRAGIVRPLNTSDVFATVPCSHPIINLAVGTQKGSGCEPIPELVGPFGVFAVVGVSGKTSGQLKEAAVRDGVLILITPVGRVYLPP